MSGATRSNAQIICVQFQLITHHSDKDDNLSKVLNYNSRGKEGRVVIDAPMPQSRILHVMFDRYDQLLRADG